MVTTKNYKTPVNPLTESFDKPTLLIDFDGVIHQWSENEEFSEDPTNPPIEGVKGAIDLLKEKYVIIIFTTRVSPGQKNGNMEAVNQAKQYVSKYLNKYQIHFDDITADKIAAKAYIDDRAFRFETWSKTLNDLQSVNLI